MAVVRIEKTKNYTVLSNVILRDKRLSMKARGLLCTMLSLPDNWQYSIAGLTSIFQEGSRCIESTLKELKRYGYVSVIKLNPSQTVSGRYEYEYVIREDPDQKQDPQNKPLETSPLKQAFRKQDLENNTLEMGGYINNLKSNTKERNTDKQITDLDIYKRKRFTPPKLEEVQAYCRERNSPVDPKQFYEYFETGHWKDSKGQPVRNWKQKLLTWEKFNQGKPQKVGANGIKLSDTHDSTLDSIF